MDYRTRIMEKIAQYSLTIYHGTDGRFLPSILEKGLQANRPKGPFTLDKGVYLTGDIEKAARYAIDGIEKTVGIPVILEIVISKPSRIKKIYRDDLDREESIREDNDYEDEDVVYLRRDVEQLIGGAWNDWRKIGFDWETYGDPAALNGLELYKTLIAYAKNKGLDLQQFKQKMFSIMPPGKTYGKYEITESGTIKMDTSGVEGMHQAVYPKSLPPSVIKAVWMSNVPEVVKGERISVTQKLLPQESKRIMDDVRNYANNNMGQEHTRDDAKEMMAWLEDMNSGHWFDEDIKALQSIAEGSTEPESMEGILEGLEMWSNENDLEGLTKPGAEFTKMTPQDALKYIQLLANKKD